jgi:hypothetical protein
MDNVEMAQDSLEKAHGHHADHAQAAPTVRVAAILVAILAAVAVVVEMSSNDAQTAYLAHDVGASDLWGQYQGKSVRHTVVLESAQLFDLQNTDASRAAAAAARADAARLADDPAGDGMKQLSVRARREEEQREHALRLHEGLERSVRCLQIAIVLVGLFMATRLFWLLGAGGLLGAGALAYGILVGTGIMH